MDCEKFEAAMMDELYGELDELTSAAVRRHLAGCGRCTDMFEGLKATRRWATLPIVEPPADLEARILAAASEAAKVVPLRRRVAWAVSMAGSWAMRPQTAMASVFLVMIGTSVLLLTGKASRAPAGAAVTVTEQGSPALGPTLVATATAPAAAATASAFVPASPLGATAAAPERAAGPSGAAALGAKLDREEAPAHNRANVTAPAAGGAPRDEDGFQGYAQGAAPTTVAPAAKAGAPPAAQAQAEGDLARSSGDDRRAISPLNAAIQAYQAGRYDEASRAFDALAPTDPSAELWAARSLRESKGCRAALARFDRVAQRAAGKPTGWDALLEGALCYRATGDYGNARTRLSALLGVDSHKDRARSELDRLNQMQPPQGVGQATAARAAPAPAAPPPPASRPAASAVDSSY